MKIYAQFLPMPIKPHQLCWGDQERHITIFSLSCGSLEDACASSYDLFCVTVVCSMKVHAVVLEMNF